MAFKDFLEEMYQPMGGVTVRPMFGGLGVFKNGVMFGLATSDDTYYLKTDAATVEPFKAEKSGPFIYDGMKGRVTAMPYYRLPERLWDDGEEFLAWSQTAFNVALRAAADKTNGKKAKAKKLTSKNPTATNAAVPKKPTAKKALPKKR